MSTTTMTATTTYLENGLIFVTSTDQSIPHGRNVRTRHRSQLAARARKQNGGFAVFDSRRSLSPRIQSDRKSRSPRVKAKQIDTDAVARRKILQPQLCRSPSLTRGMNHSIIPASIIPNKILTLATLHIRRMASIAVRSRGLSVLDVLRYRQWSCISLKSDSFGKAPYLDGAMVSVAAKLRQITFDTISPYYVFAQYDQALHCLREALQNRRTPDDDLKLLSAIQLLAIFEMLDGPDNETWQHHISGVHSIVRNQLEIPSRVSTCTSCPLIQVAPMYADALLDGQSDFFDSSPWRPLIENAISDQYPTTEHAKELIECFHDLPGLLVEAGQLSRRSSLTERLDLLARTQGMRFRIRSALVKGDVSLLGSEKTTPHFDVLGLGLSGLVALDRTITSIMPPEIKAHQISVEKSEEVCARMLQSEILISDPSFAMNMIVAVQQQT